MVGILKPALADCNEALQLVPNNARDAGKPRLHLSEDDQFDAAVSDYDIALRLNPKLASALYGRGLAKLRNEDSTGEADITAAKAIQSDIAEEYARYGVQ